MGILIALFAIIALLYSSVGFGGGSSYTAVLAWRGESPEIIRMVSLTCNLVVVLIGGWASLRAKQVRATLLIPLLVSSVPGVWVGASWSISEEMFFWVLGVALVIAGALLLLKVECAAREKMSWSVLLGIGFMLGLLAGMTGIGGGIYLVPVLHLMGAGRAREVAAVGTWFILINSAVGLVVLGSRKGLGELIAFGWLPLAVGVGGLIGSQLLQGMMNELLVRRVTGLLVLAVAVRVLFF